MLINRYISLIPLLPLTVSDGRKIYIDKQVYQFISITFFNSEWVVNQHRDTFASYIGHHHMLEFFAVAENESKARVKFSFLQVMCSAQHVVLFNLSIL